MSSWAEEILDRVSRKVLDRGKNYYHQGRVMELVQRDTNYEARVSGSQPQPYQVSIRTENDRLDGYFCDCPDDWNPICKHITAVSVAFEDDPEQFEHRQTAEDRLHSLNRNELLKLVNMMLEREPSLKRLLDHPLPGKSGSNGFDDPDFYRGEIHDLLDRYREPGMERELAREFGNILDRVEEYIDHENYGEAYALMRAFLEETVEFYEHTHDHGHISAQLRYGTELAIQLLDTFHTSQDERRTLIEFIYSLADWSIDWGGLGLREVIFEPLLEYSTKGDRNSLRESVRESIRNLDDDRHGRARDTFGEFLLELYEEDDKRSSFLSDARDLGLAKLRAECLIEDEGISEALKTARNGIKDVHERIDVANQLIDHSYTEEAGELIYDLADKKDHQKLLRWLSEYEEEYGTLEQALDVEWERLEDKPTFDRYERIMELGEKRDRPNELDRKLIDYFEKHKETKALARVHLKKENWDQAWDYVDTYREKHRGRARSLAEEAAQKSRDARPNRAIDVYRSRARHLIDRRGRDNYNEAANYLAKIRSICRETEVDLHWSSVVDEFYEYASNLPACKDEFQKAEIE